MRFTSEAEALARALSIVGRAVSRRSTIQLLSGILVEADEETGVVRLAATDMEISVSLRCRAGVEEGGRAVIPAKPLLEVVRSLDPDDDLALAVADGEATLRVAGKNAFRIRHYAADDFPVMPEALAEDAYSFTAPVAPLVAATERALPFASRDDSRPVLTGARLEFSREPDGDGARLLVATTDSYRLSVGRASLGKVPLPEGGAKAAIVPARGLTELARVAAVAMDARGPGKDGAESIGAKVTLTANHALFEVMGILVATRLIEGNFPEYGRLVPPTFEREVAVDAGALLKALKRALIFAPKGPKAGARLPVLLRLGGAANPEPTLEDPDAESLVVAAESGAGGSGMTGEPWAPPWSGCRPRPSRPQTAPWARSRSPSPSTASTSPTPSRPAPPPPTRPKGLRAPRAPEAPRRAPRAGGSS